MAMIVIIISQAFLKTIPQLLLISFEN